MRRQRMVPFAIRPCVLMPSIADIKKYFAELTSFDADGSSINRVGSIARHVGVGLFALASD